MPTEFKIDFLPPLAVLEFDLAKLAAGFRTFRVPLTTSVDRVLIPSILENFEVGGRPPWQPLSDETIARRERQGTMGGLFGSDILVESGELFGAMSHRARWKITGHEASISNLPNAAWYGMLHQGGDDFFNVNFPARPFAVMQREDQERIEAIFAAWVGGIVTVNWHKTRAGLL
jgi:phage gpG-like protein